MGKPLQLLHFFCCLMVSIVAVQAQEVKQLPPLEAKGQVVSPENIKPPVVIKLKAPDTIKAGRPRILTRTTKRKPLRPMPSKKMEASLVLIPGQGDMAYPTIQPLISKPFLAGIPEKILAGPSIKKNEGPANVLSYDLSNGLKGLNISQIYQDHLGNIWAATAYGGIFKFDGKYFHYLSEAQGLPSNSIGTIVFASDEEIWFGTYDGVSKYDGKYLTNYTTESGLAGNFALYITNDKYGNIWVAADDALQMIDRNKQTIYTFSSTIGRLDEIRSIQTDRNGNIWLGFSVKNFAILTPEKTGDTYSFRFNYFFQDIGALRYMHEDQSGHIWFGGSEGLYKISIQDKDCENLMLTNYDLDGAISEAFITHINQDETGRLWVATRRKGVFMLEPGEGQMLSYLTNLTAPDDLPDSFVSGLYQDRNHNMWLRSSGLSMIRKSPFQIFTLVENPSCITEDQRGNIWIGADQGLYQYNPASPDQILLYTQEEGLPLNDISDLIVDRKGNIWMGSFTSGLALFTPDQQGQTGTFIHYPRQTGVPSEYITRFVEDNTGAIWFSSYEATSDPNCGVAKITGNQMTLISIEQGLIYEDVMAMDYDAISGHFWIGSWGLGIAKYEPDAEGKKGKVTHFNRKHIPIENRVRTVRADRNGHIWMGGYGSVGITQFLPSKDGSAHRVRLFSLAQGLSSTTLLSALDDTEGNLWFGTAYGLNLLPADQVEQPTNPTPIISYTEADGFPAGACIKNVLFQASDGIIWVGGDDRLIRFDPKELIKEPKIPKVRLLAVSLFNQTIPWKKDTAFVLANGQKIQHFDFDSLSYFDHLPQNLSLSHQNNFIDFDYVAISIDQPGKVRYQTKLEGLEKNWSTTTANSNISYNNLKYGNYIFKVRSKLVNGSWGPPLEYAFEIRPPWWLTWWALTTCVLIGAAILYTFFRFQLKRRLEKAEALRLMELDATKTRLYTNITHEFRTPLTVISGMATQIREHPKEWFREGLAMIERNTDRLLVLVNQMLDLSKLESGKTGLNIQQGDIIPYMRYIVESIQSYSESKNIKVHFHTEEKALVMDFDPEKIQQLFINLLSNAVKFTPEGGQVDVTVAKRQAANRSGLSPNKPRLEIVVTDTGSGIPDEQLPFIFDRFYQVDDSTTRPGEGTGIGLALVKELIKLMKGDVGVKSELGKGTAFTVTLPISNQATEWIDPSEVSGRKPAILLTPVKESTPFISDEDKKETSPDSPKPRILLIEDNPDVVAYIVSLLQTDYQINVGINGREGIEIAVENIPDLIITDVMLPYKDGFEVCQILKNEERTSHIPIIMLTAKADMESKFAGLEGGADVYLTKPFHRKELLIRIRKLLDSRKRLQQYYRSLAGSAAVNTTVQDLPERTEPERHFVEKLRAIVEAHLDDVDFSLEQFCKEMGMSQSQLHRKTTALTGLSPNRFIRYVRLHKAKALLQDPDANVTTVAYDTGFNDPSYFGRVFKKEFSMTPKEWKKKHSV